MRKLALLFIAFNIIYSCHNDDTRDSNTELVGNWELIEILSDPGDGSGTFSPVTSEKTITFNNDGTLTSNGLICSMSSDIGNPSSGTYSIINFTINTSGCSNPNFNYSFEQNENILTITIPCIEPCMVKYKKSKNR